MVQEVSFEFCWGDLEAADFENFLIITVSTVRATLTVKAPLVCQPQKGPRTCRGKLRPQCVPNRQQTSPSFYVAIESAKVFFHLPYRRLTHRHCLGIVGPSEAPLHATRQLRYAQPMIRPLSLFVLVLLA